jgi:hypothetical protein
MCRFFKEGIAAPLSRKQRNDLRLLRWLFPPHYTKASHGPEAEAEDEDEAPRASGHPSYAHDPEAEARARAEAQAKDEAVRSRGHPFYDEEPGADGNFYPRDSKLRPASVDDEFVEFAYVPRYCILETGQPPIFSDEEPPGWSNYKPTAEPPPPGT